MASRPSFQFYPNDWLSSPKIALMAPEYEGAYIRLLSYCWADPHCGLPDDDEVLARLSRLGEGWLKGGSQMVRPCFIPHPNQPGMITNARLLQEREKQDAWREKSRKGGQKSAETRRKKAEKRKGKGGSRMVSTKKEPQGNSSSSSSSSSSDQDPPSPPSKDNGPLFSVTMDALGICEMLRRSILEYEPEDSCGKLTDEQWRQLAREQWGPEIDRLNRCDKVRWADISKAARLLPRSYWSRHIFDGRAFRQKFKQLMADLKEKKHWDGRATDQAAAEVAGVDEEALLERYKVGVQ
jgi:uncharacterized protein YdaU (DUF1376 family)